MIKEKLLKEIEAYCKLNEIDDVEMLVNKMLLQGFTIKKFGLVPPGFKEPVEAVVKTEEPELKVEEPIEEPTKEVTEVTTNVYNITIEEKKEDKKPIAPPPDDLYGEGGKGFWGSNLLD